MLAPASSAYPTFPQRSSGPLKRNDARGVEREVLPLRLDVVQEGVGRREGPVLPLHEQHPEVSGKLERDLGIPLGVGDDAGEELLVFALDLDLFFPCPCFCTLLLGESGFLAYAPRFSDGDLISVSPFPLSPRALARVRVKAQR
eukprot:CAMPEP_0206240388 /NCGR_PEP_ID=MMETSP0047_2-20121206/15912_1 /ASSEMBLY_ACC=CAM_ASM_000192 /TAXON_ID=195065 /ORGANISM="Chroomonas mesostigmatica_cf, Strain CCMP1168" /LENGTH=143 /DNA_ID=CAMNT_0053665167 /DNA_START=251 /DNA_END=680 /DNA_ORIENTATION=+